MSSAGILIKCCCFFHHQQQQQNQHEGPLTVAIGITVLLPMILVEIEVNQMLSSSYDYKLAIGIYFMNLHLIKYFHV